MSIQRFRVEVQGRGSISRRFSHGCLMVVEAGLTVQPRPARVHALPAQPPERWDYRHEPHALLTINIISREDVDRKNTISCLLN